MKRMGTATLSVGVALALALTGCRKPVSTGVPKEALKTSAEAEEACDAPSDGTWLPSTKPPVSTAIPDEAEDCDFYKAAYQNFLFATEFTSNKRPAFLSYPTIETLFGLAAGPLFPKATAGMLSVATRVAKLPNEFAASDPATIGSGVHQAGAIRGVLADANGYPIYYSIHVSPTFRDFIVAKGLTTAAALKAADDKLPFPGGVAEFKAAWQVVPSGPAPTNYITTEAWVPTLSIKAGDLVADAGHPRKVTLKLIAFHVAFTLDNHPEMIWSTFEHVIPATQDDADAISDVAPVAKQRPPATPAVTDPGSTYSLFTANSAVSKVLLPAKTADFDPGTQRFRTPSPVYRIFPGSKADQDGEDDAVLALDRSVAKLFKSAAATDKRVYYRLVGAVWLKHPLDRPAQPGQPALVGSFKLNAPLINPDPLMSTDNPASTLSGEGTLSSTAMESFTQTSKPHCFRCHDAQVVNSDVTGDPIVAPKLLNVSHVLSRFLSEAP